MKTIISVLFGIALTWSVQVFALPSIQKAFTDKYPATVGSQLNSCATCHMPIKADFLNTYGIALRDSKLNFDAIADIDSDEDGKTNIKEITELTPPGSQADEFEQFIFINKAGNIYFNHAAHVMNADYTINGNCTLCHVDDTNHFPKYFNATTLVKTQGHATCLGCHRTSGHANAPTQCMGCHKNKRE
ncbi:MAG: cytochrome c3 family protein [Deltaproteobacteria bacterium]|nr:cytochrome c3 family protein [Deltaproteobacteria bacterium]